jgi:hypothetical protein
MGHFFDKTKGPAPTQIRDGFLTRASVLVSKKFTATPVWSPCGPLPGCHGGGVVLGSGLGGGHFSGLALLL